MERINSSTCKYILKLDQLQELQEVKNILHEAAAWIHEAARVGAGGSGCGCKCGCGGGCAFKYMVGKIRIFFLL